MTIVRNDSSESVPAFGIMRITGASNDSAGQFFLTINKPNTSFETYYLVNGPFAIQAGDYGAAEDLQNYYAAYDDGDGTPSYGQSWGAKNGQWKLALNRDGFDILGNPTNGRVLVRQHKVTQLIGKLAMDLNSGGTAAATVWLGAGGSEGAGEYGVTLRDWLIPSGKKIVSGTKIIALLIRGVWYLSEAGACMVDQ